MCYCIYIHMLFHWSYINVFLCHIDVLLHTNESQMDVLFHINVCLVSSCRKTCSRTAFCVCLCVCMHACVCSCMCVFVYVRVRVRE